MAPILLVAAEDASLWSSRRLEHEYALKGELDVAWAARPVALSRYNDRLALVLEDPGGERLDQLLGRPLEDIGIPPHCDPSPRVRSAVCMSEV